MKSLSRYVAIAITLVALSSTALAGGMGQGGQGGMGGGNQGTPPAEGMGPGGHGGPGEGPGGRLLVASDGKALLVQVKPAASSTASPTILLTAVNPAGTAAWSWTAPSQIHDLVLSGSLVVLTVGGQPQAAGSSTSSGTATPAQIIALNLASGTQAWAVTPDGVPGDLAAAPTGVETIIRKVTAATGTATQPTVTRTLVLIDAAGKTVWSLALDV